jgi:hypothetical protein
LAASLAAAGAAVVAATVVPAAAGAVCASDLICSVAAASFSVAVNARIGSFELLGFLVRRLRSSVGT